MDSFLSEKIVGDVIDAIPAKTCQVIWTEPNVSANVGNIVTPTQIKHEPEVTYEADENSYYSLVMLDPDAPSRSEPIYGEFLHWLIVNIPGNKIKEGELKTSYRGSGAPKGSGLHRYCFFVLKQEEKQDFSHLPIIPSNLREPRRNFKTREFIQKYKMNLISGNFVRAEWDEYVLELQKQQ